MTAAAPPLPAPVARPVGRHVVSVLELAVATWIAYRFGIEGSPLTKVMILAIVGFAVSPWLPLERRQPFFVLLSLAGIVLTFGALDGALLVGGGLLLVACCHLPISFRARVALLLVLGTLLALGRAGMLPSPWSAAVWPVFGSMFMFRLVIYLRDTDSKKADWSPSGAMSYFFQFPNLIFPLYPVMDYQTFRKSHFDRPEWETYETGMLWITRGLMHLVGYRVIYMYVVNDPLDVADLSDLVRNMLGTFLLYLRVSGQFHLIVGLLHLFGYRLPETHHLYYLSRSFTDLWRRINIYWKDFMLQLVFYPAYFKLKRRGAMFALAWSTVLVFVATWVLHSYQWFWLRGGFPITMPDILFWGILGGLVVYHALREAKQPPKPRRAAGFDVRAGLEAATTFTIFCFLWSLWSAESVTQWVWMISAGVHADLLGILLLLATFTTLFLLGGWNWDAAPPAALGWLGGARGARVRRLSSLAVLGLLTVPSVEAAAPEALRTRMVGLRENRLNARDQATQHRGYYEQLEVRARIGDASVAVRPPDWQDVGSLGVIRETQTSMTRELVPSRTVDWNGKPFTTNSFGMRDREYAVEKPPASTRIAILGPSHVMGNGVGDGESFEALIEDRLHAEGLAAAGHDIEILNFAVDGFSLPQQVNMLEERVLRFAPDIVIVTHYRQDRMMTERYLLKLRARGLRPYYPPVAALFDREGLSRDTSANFRLPTPTLRRIAGAFGIRARMPQAEAEGHARRISDEVLELSFERFAEVARGAGAVPVVLVLDDVLDEDGTEVPDDRGIRSAGIEVINLLGIYPKDRRPALRVAAWDNHPNAEGHRFIAEQLYPHLVRVLRDAPANPTPAPEAASEPASATAASPLPRPAKRNGP